MYYRSSDAWLFHHHRKAAASGQPRTKNTERQEVASKCWPVISASQRKQVLAVRPQIEPLLNRIFPLYLDSFLKSEEYSNRGCGKRSAAPQHFFG